MKDNNNDNNTFPGPIHRSNGITPSERYLQGLCETAFLKLWSYPGIYRDQGKIGSTKEGKEVCDLLVVFDNHIIIFSDKSCEFPDSGDLSKDWCRWYRRAILSSAKQIWGAERWIKDYPDRLFLDRKCTQPFPYKLPPPDKVIFHRIVVARNSAIRSRGTLGGSGSLMIFPHIVGEEHINEKSSTFMPLAVGQIDPNKGFVHVLDDTSLNILLNTLDTITDFVNYLIKKEDFILSGRLLNAAGEEELLAHYLIHIGEDGEHDFVFSDEYAGISIGEGIWEGFETNPQRIAQIEEDKISYIWDELIKTFSKHIIGATLVYSEETKTEEHEISLRFLARAPRFHRRVLSKAFMEIIKKAEANKQDTAVRLSMPHKHGEPLLVFLVLADRIFKTEEEYRLFRKELLAAYCQVAKLLFPEIVDFVGVAVDHPVNGKCSEDLVYVNTQGWTKKDNEEAKRIQKELNILVDLKQSEAHYQEYPEILDPPKEMESTSGDKSRKKIGRNKPCPCGSGKKYKHCCLR